MKKVYFGIALISVLVFASNQTQAEGYVKIGPDTLVCKQYVGDVTWNNDRKELKNSFKCYPDGPKAKISGYYVTPAEYAGYYGYKKVYFISNFVSGGQLFIDMKVSK